MKSLKRILCAAFLLLAFCAAPALTGAAAMPGDIDGDGQITPADARIVLRISVGLEKIEDYFPDWRNGTDPSTPGTDGPGTDQPGKQEIPEDLEFQIAFDITDGGYFVGGASKAAISVTPNADLAAAKLAVVDAAEEAVFTETLKNLKKDQPATVEWDGKSGDTYALSGDYTVVVTAGEKENKLEGLNFTQKNYFSEGNGSEAHPFLVTNKEDFANVVRFPRAHFKQTKDIDYNLEANTSMFTEDAPFNGVYDGNGKAFMNLLTTNPLFNYIGADGKILNVVTKDSSFTCKSVLAIDNKGQINGCQINAILNYTQELNYTSGFICISNSGLIVNCASHGSMSTTRTHPNGQSGSDMLAGGLVGYNTGKILSCVSDIDLSLSVNNNHPGYAGGIAADNGLEGFIQNCESKGAFHAYQSNRIYIGCIAGYNSGQILSSINTGEDTHALSGGGPGIVA